jgi:ABC-2 type transport system ATP-binding protein
MSVIALSFVSKSFGGRAVLDQLNWEVRQGQVIGLLGRNGAGKSTLLACLLGVCPRDSGTAHLFGESVDDLSSAVRANIGYVPQTPDLFGWQTPTQMLAYFKALYPRWNDAKVEALLQRWGFDGALRHRLIGNLSGGEQQRLSIIRALAHAPSLLVFDEPVSALDPVGRRDFLRELIDGVIERGTTVVFSTHILTDLERVAPDVAFLSNGKIALQGELDSLLEQACRVSGPAALLAKLRLQGELGRSSDGAGGIEIIVRDSHSATDALALAGNQGGVRIERLNLEDLFVAVTQ